MLALHLAVRMDGDLIYTLDLLYVLDGLLSLYQGSSTDYYILTYKNRTHNIFLIAFGSFLPLISAFGEASGSKFTVSHYELSFLVFLFILSLKY